MSAGIPDNPHPRGNASLAEPCRLCGSATAPFMWRGQFQIMECRTCGFMFALLPAGYDPLAIYSDEAYWTGGRDYGYRSCEQESLASRSLYAARLERLQGLCATGKMLEVGCAGGRFLKAAQDQRWSVAGVELSEMMRRRCAEIVACPLYGSLEEAAAGSERFDCVAMFEVIEHLADPLHFLRRVRDMMVTGGVLALSTPNFDAPQALQNPENFHWFSPPAHVSYFRPAALLDCAARAGFRTIRLVGVLEGEEMPLPRGLAALLTPFRKGKRLRPGGLAGKLIKAYQRRRADILQWANAMELYARNPPSSVIAEPGRPS